jgi:hypothetical protein
VYLIEMGRHQPNIKKMKMGEHRPNIKQMGQLAQKIKMGQHRPIVQNGPTPPKQL